MEELFDKDGTLVEGALSPDEVDAKLEEERAKIEEEFEKDNQLSVDELQREIDKAIEEKEALSEELAKEKGKDKNFGALRGKVGQKEDIITSMKEEMEKLKGELDLKITGIKTDTNKQIISESIKSLAKEDKELADKIQFHFDTFKASDNKDEILKNIKNAYTLATGSKPVSALGSSVLSANGGAPLVEKKKENLSDEGKKQAKEFGLSDADLKKHNLL